MTKTMTTHTIQQIAKRLVAIKDINAWLGRDKPAQYVLDCRVLARDGDENAQWLMQCIYANDASALRSAATSIIARNAQPTV